jgi:hypothetical protein
VIRRKQPPSLTPRYDKMKAVIAEVHETAKDDLDRCTVDDLPMLIMAI